jgi:hypothetical protein
MCLAEGIHECRLVRIEPNKTAICRYANGGVDWFPKKYYFFSRKEAVERWQELRCTQVRYLRNSIAHLWELKVKVAAWEVKPCKPAKKSG